MPWYEHCRIRKVCWCRLDVNDSFANRTCIYFFPVSGSSFDSYNLSTDSYALHPLRYNSPSSFNASNNSFNVAANVLLDTNAYGGVSVSPSSTAYNHHQVAMNGLSTPTAYGQTAPTYNHQSVVNLQSISIPGNYSPNSSNYSASYDPNSNYMTQNSPTFNTSSYVDNQYDEHMKKQIDEQLSKVSQLSLMQNSARASSKMLDQAIVGLNPKNNIILSQIHVSNELAKSCRTICNSKETFYWYVWMCESEQRRQQKVRFRCCNVIFGFVFLCFGFVFCDFFFLQVLLSSLFLYNRTTIGLVRI